MQTFTIAAALMLLAYNTVSASPAQSMPPAAVILSEALQPMHPTTTAPGRPMIASSAPTPTYTPEQQDPSNCKQNVQGCGEASNWSSHRAPTCKTANDCTKYCKTTLGNVKNIASSCQANMDYPGSGKGLESLCTCWDGQFVVDVVTNGAIGIGEVACFVWDEALTRTPQVLKAIGTLSKLQALKWAGKIISVGDHLLAHGSKIGKCDNSMCPGHSFVVVDPKKLEKELGVLNAC